MCDCGEAGCHSCQYGEVTYPDNFKKQRLIRKDHLYGVSKCSKIIHCIVCDQIDPYRYNVTLDCPQIELTAQQIIDVQNYKIDFFKGKWWTADETA